MRITLVTSGSRGDVEPYVALGEGLNDSGHEVTIATEARFEAFVLGRGLKFALIPGDTYAAINSPEGQQALNGKNNTRAFFNHLMDASAPLVDEIVLQSLAACKNADHIICTHFSLFTVYFLSQYLRVPFSMASVNPMVSGNTAYFPNMLFLPWAKWSPEFMSKYYNINSHKGANLLWWTTYKRLYAGALKKAIGLTLPAINPVHPWRNGKPPLSLFGYSPHVLPKPKDWGSHQHICGYWFLKADEDWKPLPELEEFINAGPRPIYMGFGSMNNSMLKNNELEKLIIEVVAKTKQRAVILKQGLNFNDGRVSTDIYATGPVPFKYLFPKMRLLVHHGGAGTTALGLGAGVPSVITPLIVDQRFWAWRVEKLGVAPEPVHWHSLNADKLASAINTWVDNSAAKATAAELGKRISAENGVETAVRIFNEVCKAS